MSEVPVRPRAERHLGEAGARRRLRVQRRPAFVRRRPRAGPAHGGSEALHGGQSTERSGGAMHAAIVRRRAHGRRTARELRPPRGRGGPQPAAGPGPRRQRARRARPLVRALARAAYTAGAPSSTSSTWTRTSAGRRSRGAARTSSALAAVAGGAAEQVGRATTHCSRSRATRSPSCTPISTASVSAERGMREVAEASLEAHRRALQLDDRRLPERGLGADGARRARRRTAVGRGRDAVRLDTPDPVAAWREHLGHLPARAPP